MYNIMQDGELALLFGHCSLSLFLPRIARDFRNISFYFTGCLKTKLKYPAKTCTFEQGGLLKTRI